MLLHAEPTTSRGGGCRQQPAEPICQVAGRRQRAGRGGPARARRADAPPGGPVPVPRGERRPAGSAMCLYLTPSPAALLAAWRQRARAGALLCSTSPLIRLCVPSKGVRRPSGFFGGLAHARPVLKARLRRKAQRILWGTPLITSTASACAWRGRRTPAPSCGAAAQATARRCCTCATTCPSSAPAAWRQRCAHVG